jgi:hypothetical protein
MKLAQSLLVLLLAVRAVPAADVAITDYLPAGTKVVFGVNLRKIADSPIGQSAIAQAKAQVQSKMKGEASATDFLKLVALAGFDPMHDIDEVLLATNAEGQNPPSLVVIAGHFDVAKLGSIGKPYHDVPLIGGDKPTDGVVALLNETTVLAGDRPTVLAAIDHLGRGAQIGSALAQRIADARNRYDVWAFGDKPEGFVAPTPQASALESIDRFEVGVSMSHGVEMGAEVHARSAKDAQQIGAMLGMLDAMMKSKQTVEDGTNFVMSTEKNTFKLSLLVPEASVLKALASQSMTATTPTQAVAEKPAAWTAPVISNPEAQPQWIPYTAAPPAPTPAPAPAAPKPAAATMVMDKEGNTVILTLPGAKKQ